MLDDRLRSEQFPSLGRMTYLNTGAEGIPPRVVHEALDRYFADKLTGMAGREGHFATLEKARTETAAAFGLSLDEVGICSCSSEAYNLLAGALRLKAGDEIIINDLDFPAGATPWLTPASPTTVRLWKAREGALHVEDLVPLLSPRTRLVQTSLVSFLNGFVAPLQEIADAVRRHSNAVFSVDVTQALGRIPLDLSAADVVISSTHKWILATHGGGLVGVRKRAADRLQVQAGGWFNLEDAFGAKRFESAHVKPGAAGFAVGMPNFPAIYAIAAALQYIRTIGADNIDRFARPLVQQCIDEISRLPVKLITPRSDVLAGIVSFTHPKMDQINAELLKANIHVMAQQGRMRVSLHGYNRAADVEKLVSTLKEAMKRV